jgi:hypothetical protein
LLGLNLRQIERRRISSLESLTSGLYASSERTISLASVIPS